jgi:hypothetical protein
VDAHLQGDQRVERAKRDYKPQENSRSAWDLAHHIAIADVGFRGCV